MAVARGMSSRDILNARILSESERELIYSSPSVKQIASVLGLPMMHISGDFQNTPGIGAACLPQACAQAACFALMMGAIDFYAAIRL